MASAALELQKAVFARLSASADLIAALGGPRIFDHAPAAVAFPYVTFGRTSAYDWSTGTEIGTEQLFTLHVWSKELGKAQSLEILEAIRTALLSQPLEVAGHAVASLREEFAEARFDEDIDVYHGLLRFRALLEPVD